MPSFAEGVVESIECLSGGVLEGTVRLDDGSRARVIVLESLTGGASVGDRLVLNTTALELGLGSGGYHFALWNLTSPVREVPSKGHVMKLRYTALQTNVETLEEALRDSGAQPHQIKRALDGMPVIAGSVHSQLLPAALAFKEARPQGKLAYVMTDGGCLPLGLSHTVRFLKELGVLDFTISCGHAFGGDYEAVSVAGALACARRLLDAEAAVVVMGPGIVGTRSALGFSGIEQADVINQTAALGGRPIGALRLSFADSRPTHRGVSHHSLTVFGALTLAPAVVALPELPDREKMELVLGQLQRAGIPEKHELKRFDSSFILGRLDELGYSATFMGRGHNEEPEFFLAAAAAGLAAGLAPG